MICQIISLISFLSIISQPYLKILNSFKKIFPLLMRQIFSMHDVQAADWLSNSTNNNVNNMFDTLYSVLSKLIDKHIRIVKRSKRQVKCRSKP